jgi:lysyl-tRNA synthetase class 2
MSTQSWRPSAGIITLQARAKLIQKIRQFFIEREVLEVETPLVSHHTVTDPYLESLQCQLTADSSPLYLQTSPEYHMKRLLAAGSGSIFQICKNFRVDEQGRIHNPEFTLLEWYRVGFTHHDLMDEMDAFLQLILQQGAAQRLTYQAVFLKYLEIDPLSISGQALADYALKHGINDPGLDAHKDDWLMLLFSQLIEPKLQAVTFIYDYPASQAALAKINADNLAVCDRFEVYAGGVELANGFHELTDAAEQRQRFVDNQAKRKQQQQFVPALDAHFLTALEHGLPACAGVALGVDRLVMLALQQTNLASVLSFDFQRA